MDYEIYRASMGDMQAVKRMWEKNRETLKAGVFNPFGILPGNELERRAVFILLGRIEQTATKIQKRKWNRARVTFAV